MAMMAAHGHTGELAHQFRGPLVGHLSGQLEDLFLDVVLVKGAGQLQCLVQWVKAYFAAPAVKVRPLQATWPLQGVVAFGIDAFSIQQGMALRAMALLLIEEMGIE